MSFEDEQFEGYSSLSGEDKMRLRLLNAQQEFSLFGAKPIFRGQEPFSMGVQSKIEINGYQHSAIELREALISGDIHPWFQPRISLTTGQITGFEALPRWSKEPRGLIPPSEFLLAIEQAGLMKQLGENMLLFALKALRGWDQAGVNVPSVAVNFSEDELCNPELVKQVAYYLDSFGVKENRLLIEVLESAISGSEDTVVTRNIGELANLGCKIALDDFGTGHASIASIKKSRVNQINIDRSLFMQLDRDPEQKKMVIAILNMAERLSLDTLADGVENSGEHAILAQLGCGHCQGFAIAKPMTFSDTIQWISRYEANVPQTSSENKRA